MKHLLSLIAVLFLAMKMQGAIHTETVDYQQGGTTLEGFVAYDDSVSGKRPGVLIVHQWQGITDYEKMRAKMLAQMGYVAFCADIYGKDSRPKSLQDAGALAGKFKNDRPLLRARVNAGLDELKGNPYVDPDRVAAIGYCFGGTTVIELARSGAQLKGIVSFHGGLDSPSPADARNIRCKLLILAGADDPFQKPADLGAFEKEMRDAKVDWQITFYGGAVHAFTQREVDKLNLSGAKYNENADKRSWQAMKDFFAEIFE
ncbi:MAG TPA: dienelactone hydrolase family protein [Verrucomicrobiae bacterium]|nr:dienelactone hydrolase family protein [Verrucomicrobiae bacterium]